jgi:hypothetical protein
MTKESLKTREWFVVSLILGLMLTLALISFYTAHRTEGKVRCYLQLSAETAGD